MNTILTSELSTTKGEIDFKKTNLTTALRRGDMHKGRRGWQRLAVGPLQGTGTAWPGTGTGQLAGAAGLKEPRVQTGRLRTRGGLSCAGWGDIQGPEVIAGRHPSPADPKGDGEGCGARRQYLLGGAGGVCTEARSGSFPVQQRAMLGRRPEHTGCAGAAPPRTAGSGVGSAGIPWRWNEAEAAATPQPVMPDSGGSVRTA